MQSPSTIVAETDGEFSELRFERIYHEGPFRGERDVTRSRCAEVMAPSPFSLDSTLKGIMCRSPAERATLLHMLGPTAAMWRDRIRVWSQPGLFENRFSYVDTVDVDSKKIHFALHPREDGQLTGIKLEILDLNGSLLRHFNPWNLDPKKKWYIDHGLAAGTYSAKFTVEDCFAYEAPFLIDDLPF